jgi:hypothetical protein
MRRRRIMDKKELENYMRTPRDITEAPIEDKANILTLHFIGFIARPIGIEDKIYEKCLEAFSSNRGQFEWEMEAILEVLKEQENG